MAHKQQVQSQHVSPKRRWVIAGFVILIVAMSYAFIALATFDPNRRPELGITFSKPFAQSLGLDWRAAYLALLDEVGVRHVRIPTYWNQVERVEGQYDFADIDWMMDEAHKRGARVVLTLGMRQPRWPECHFPDWVRDVPREVLSVKVQQLLITTVNRYKAHPALEYWQVENEPLLEFFGECPRPDRQLIQDEVSLVRALDDRKIVMTVSGELSAWYPEALWGDILGSTLYRITWNETLAKLPGYNGYWSYWFMPASIYRVKAFLVGQDLDDFWIAELQAEPWFPGDPLTTPLTEQYLSMSPKQLLKNVEYAYRVNPSRVYLWGAEWWYYTKEAFGATEIWETVKRLDW